MTRKIIILLDYSFSGTQPLDIANGVWLEGEDLSSEKIGLIFQMVKLNAYNIKGARTLTVMSTQVINLLNSTLNPSMLESSQREIQRTRRSQGFGTDLLNIADSDNNDMNIRQSALIVLKNMVYDQRQHGDGINLADYEFVKDFILKVLARQWGNKHLTPTLREIIHIIADMDFPNRWPNILPAILHNIN